MTLGLSLFGAGSGCTGTPAPKTPAAVAALPPMKMQTLDGAETTLHEAVAGRVTLLTLWATWCDACRDELGPLARLAERSSAMGAQVLAVDVGESPARVAAFVRAHRLSYAQLLDPRFQLSDALGSRRVPTTLVIDAGGNILYRGGALDGAALEAFRGAIGQARTAGR